MRTIRIYALTIVLLLCISCKTQQLVTCEDVTKANDMTWLSSIVKTGITPLGQKLVRISKIIYSEEGTNTTSVGFYIEYETMCCDIPDAFIYDCDGEIITTYGGIAGCQGECSLKVLSSTAIYTAK